MTNRDTIVRHHLLEIILWPNGDGTFTEIRNSKERLKELGIYNDFKMTIPMTRAEHARLHSLGKSGYWAGKTGPHKGKTHSEETRKKISESMKGNTNCKGKTHRKMKG